MPGTKIAIALTQSRLDVGILRAGRLGAVESRSLDPDTFEESWRDDLRPLDGPLASCIEALGADGASATLLHCGPSVVGDVFSCPASGGAALEAARLALIDHANLPLESSPHDIVPIASDRAAHERQQHVLIAADRDSSASAALEWMRRAGLSPEMITSLDGLLLAGVLRQAIADRRDACLILRVGEHASVLALSENGRIRMLRRVSLSISALTEAVARSLAGSADTDAPLPRDEAREIVMRLGIPERDAVVCSERKLHGRDLLPLLQPVLQRAIVEIKQSLRFGLDESSRSTIAISLRGPGASIPSLATVISEQCAVPCQAEAEVAAIESDLAMAVAGLDIAPCLLPKRAQQTRFLRSVKRALVAGSVAALIIGGIDAAATFGEVASAKEELAELLPARTAAEELTGRRDRMIAARQQLAAAQRAILESVGRRSHWGALFAELSIATPEHIRINEVVGSTQKTEQLLTLQGYVYTEAAQQDSDTALNRYIETIENSPLVAGVRLGSTQRTRLDGYEALRFAVVIEVRSVPLQLAAAGSENG